MVHPSEVFLSHSSHDAQAVALLANVLSTHGVSVFYSPHNIVGAQQWHDEIGKALSRCDWFILVLSPHAVSSKWVNRELMFALDDDRYEERILPVIMQDCDFSRWWVLRQFQMIDFEQEFDRGCRKLLEVWGIDYSPPANNSA